MPVTIGETSWSQDENYIKIRVKLNSGVSLNSLDIFTHSEYIKLNAPPFYREIFLHKPIDEAQSRCKIVERCVYFMLKKKEPVNWNELEFDLNDKVMKRDLKEQVINEVQETTKRASDEKCKRKEDVKRKDMLTEIDRQSRQREEREEIVEMVIREEIQAPIKCAVKPQPIPKIRPAIRESGSITVTFSDRIFPTPQRESQSQLEEEWLLKQLQAKRIVGFVEGDLREDERNPQWLFDKGNTFYKDGNYLGAISAYTTAIKLTPNAYQLYLNRAGAQYCEANYMRCAEDCSKALELLEPKVEPNKAPRIQCLARRGAALCKLGFLKEGCGEMDAAWQLDKSNKSLREDLDQIERVLQAKE